MNVQDAPASVDLIHEVMIYAENELAALYGAVQQLFGLEQARLAAEDWLRELQLMEWPDECAFPNWKQPTHAALRLLAERTGAEPVIAGGVSSAVNRW
jgi:hypothetical protein